MTTEVITKLDHPIDVMALVHKAFRAVSGRADDLAERAIDGGDLDELQAAFELWMKQLVYHAATEDEHMTREMLDCPPARDNEDEHVRLADSGGELARFMGRGNAAGLEESVRDALCSLEQQQHEQLEQLVEEAQAALGEALGEKRVTARTRRHLYRRLAALRCLELDHFENEEAFVIPLVRERMTEDKQLVLVRRLLIDESAPDPRWIIDWVKSELAPVEQDLLAGLEARFEAVTAF